MTHINSFIAALSVDKSYLTKLTGPQQDFQLWCDLCELEIRVGRRWVTDDADYDRWTRYARSKNLSIPRSAEQLHKSLAGD